jgi:hypothetical protein
VNQRRSIFLMFYLEEWDADENGPRCSKHTSYGNFWEAQIYCRTSSNI